MGMFRKITLPIVLLLMSEALIIFLFPGSLVFKSTITAGGDTPVHFMSAAQMHGGLLSFFSPVTWVYGAYAGFPLFLNYFPLPFALTALISKAVSLRIAFKLVTLLAIIPLPAAVYLCLRLLGYRQNTPAIGAVLSLPFLLMTANSMWGGNICSTLSGEFAFGISLILYIVFTGKLYADIAGQKSLPGNSVLEALIAMSHGYSVIQSLMGSSYFVVRGRSLKDIKYIALLHAAAAGLAAFWLLPLLWRLPWDTPYSFSWHFKSWTEIAPPVLWPSFAGTLIVVCSGGRNLLRPRRELPAALKESTERPELYLVWQLGIALLGFSLAPSLGLVDVRFLPFAQIMLVLLGAVGWGRLLSRLPCPNLWLVVFCAGVAAVALTRAPFVDSWIRWNYSGMESKPLWNSYRLVNEYLSGDANTPRVVYEHNEITNSAGSIRAFELLPYFSGRSTLGGLYMQSSLTSPFVFYIQSELSQIPSRPFPQYYYSRPDPGRAAAHLRLFNVSQVVAVSDNIADALDSSPAYELRMTFPPYRIYRLRRCADSYVEPLRFKPLRITARNWKKVQFDWFRKSSLKVPLVVASKNSSGEFWKNLQAYGGDPEHIPEVPIAGSENVRAQAVLGDGRIVIDTSRPGYPLWIKVSYHPDWRITRGAGELYLASPAFMLLVPKTSRVVLTFDTGTGIYLWGEILFFITILAFVLRTLLARTILLPFFWKKRTAGMLARQTGHGGKLAETAESSPPRSSRQGTSTWLLAALALMGAVILGAISTRSHRSPVLLYQRAADKLEGINDMESGPGGQARHGSPALRQSPEDLRALDLLNECMEKFGPSSVLDDCMFYKASLMSAWKQWGDLRPMLRDFLQNNPDSRIYAEALTWMGEASLNMGQKEDAKRFFRRALSSWPENNATKQAGLLLAKIVGADELLRKAKSLFASGRYLEAYNIYGALALSPDKKIRDESVISLAYCSFYMNRWQEASDLFLRWLNDNFNAPESARVQADFRRCQTLIAQNRQWTNPGSRSSPAVPSGLTVRFLDWIGQRLH